MNEKPILFNIDMVQAILDGRKTQTRRVVKPQPELYPPGWLYGGEYYMDDAAMQSYLFHDVYGGDAGSPYGGTYADGTSDLLWVRETHWIDWYPNGVLDADGRPGCVHYRAAHPYPVISKSIDGKWRPSIFMPRWASRITLRVTAVRVERVRDISEGDAKAEGAPVDWPGDWTSCGCYKSWFSRLWNRINAKRGYPWDSNPWVWVVEFERVALCTKSQRQ